MFETNLRDERFLPFEGAGAISTWSLGLPSEFRPFDYMTISDVILHVRYTARRGGDSLGNQMLIELKDMLKTANKSGLASTLRTTSSRTGQRRKRSASSRPGHVCIARAYLARRPTQPDGVFLRLRGTATPGPISLRPRA